MINTMKFQMNDIYLQTYLDIIISKQDLHDNLDI